MLRNSQNTPVYVGLGRNTTCLDGGHISTLLATFFVTHLPELILAGKVYSAMPPLFKVTKGKQSKWLYTVEELKDYSGWETTRYKGLGEMGAIELWESTMDPATRKLVQLKPSDMKSTQKLLQTLMGNSSNERREFIMANASKYRLMDEDTYDVSEGDE